jgi:RNase adaptor protein for sRNA GlmZ degradation
MDEKSRAKLNSILAKDPNSLIQADISFLKARRGYLNQDQLYKYREFFSNNTYKQEKSEQPKQENKVHVGQPIKEEINKVKEVKEINEEKIDISTLNHTDLLRLAKKRGYSIKFGITNRELRALFI